MYTLLNMIEKIKLFLINLYKILKNPFYSMHEYNLKKHFNDDSINFNLINYKQEIQKKGVYAFPFTSIFFHTRFLSSYFKNVVKDKQKAGEVIQIMTKENFSASIKVVTAFLFLDMIVYLLKMNSFNDLLEYLPGVLSFIIKGLIIYIVVLMIFRIFEITYAFLSDFKQQSNNHKTATQLTSADRIELAIISYLEVIINFAMINYAFTIMLDCGLKPVDAMSNGIFLTFYDALYYSGVTITTLGYGDLTPVNPVLKFLAVSEVLVGFVLVLLAIGIYMSKKDDNATHSKV